MENKIGSNVTQYDGVLVRRSIVGNNVVLGDDVFVTDSNIGNHCSIERRGMIFNSKIEDYSYTGYNTVVKYAHIGRFCSISWNVSIGGANHDYSHLTTHPFPFNAKYGLVESCGNGYDSFNIPLTIGNDVWIGANACITRGVTIGDGAVIGAGAVVTHSVPPYEIWAGVPAKKIGQRFDNDIIKQMLELKWWDLPEDVIRHNISVFNENITLGNIKRIKENLKDK